MYWLLQQALLRARVFTAFALIFALTTVIALAELPISFLRGVALGAVVAFALILLWNSYWQTVETTRRRRQPKDWQREVVPERMFGRGMNLKTFDRYRFALSDRRHGSPTREDKVYMIARFHQMYWISGWLRWIAAAQNVYRVRFYDREGKEHYRRVQSLDEAGERLNVQFVALATILLVILLLSIGIPRRRTERINGVLHHRLVYHQLVHGQGVVLLLLLLLFAAAILIAPAGYFYVDWWSKVFMVTNQSVALLRVPPAIFYPMKRLLLPYSVGAVEKDDLEDSTFANALRLNFGSILLDTRIQRDQPIAKIEYVIEHEEVRGIINYAMTPIAA